MARTVQDAGGQDRWCGTARTMSEEASPPVPPQPVVVVGAGGAVRGVGARRADGQRAGDGWREPAVRLAATVGGLWLDALKMTVVPLIIALLITGIVGGADAARAGGVAGRSFAWFVAVLTGSAIFGALAMIALLNLFPLPAEAANALRAGLAGVDANAASASVPTLNDFIKGVIPTNPIAAAANDKILPMVVFTALFAFAVTRIEPGAAAHHRQLLPGDRESDAGADRLGACGSRRSGCSGWPSRSAPGRAGRRSARCSIMSCSPRRWACW